jgi:hypothetical protein
MSRINDFAAVNTSRVHLPAICSPSTTDRGDGGKTHHRSITIILSFTVLGMLFIPEAHACAWTEMQAPFAIHQLRLDPQDPLESVSYASLVRDLSVAPNANNPSIVGMWNIQFLSQGNTTHNPSIPDGAMIDFGYNQWHDDGTEILNSGARAPAQQNFCLGVWQKTAHSTYQLNHFALNYNPTTGAFIGRINIVETVTLSAGGTSYSGTFVYTVFDAKNNETDRLTGQVAAGRITVDTTIP